MFQLFKKNKYRTALLTLIIAYILYFSYLTILRMKTLYASYFDLGIMHQTVYNTYKLISTFDFSRFLEMTNPHGFDQVKRMSVHNDILLALLAPFYFIYSGPETLLVIQTIVLALGAWVVYKISLLVFEKEEKKDLIGLSFAFGHLFYVVMQRANLFDFHAVTLSTTFLLCVYYFWLKKQYKLSFIFLILSLISKEQVGLTTFFLGLNIIWQDKGKNKYGYIVGFLSLCWFILSISLIIPHFRGERHFATGYYSDLGESSMDVFIGLIKKPQAISKYIFRDDTLKYFLYLLGPLGFLSLLDPLRLLIALPEFGINLLSNSWNMRNIIYHYTAVIQPFVFISAIYGSKKILNFFEKKKINVINPIILVIIISTIAISYFKSPLPYSKEKEIHPFLYPQKEAKEVILWSKTLKDESLRISATGHLAPFFTSRRYYYFFSDSYPLADYVVIRRTEIYNYPEKELLIPVYESLAKDERYKQIYKNGDLEVFKKLITE